MMAFCQSVRNIFERAARLATSSSVLSRSPLLALSILSGSSFVHGAASAETNTKPLPYVGFTNVGAESEAMSNGDKTVLCYPGANPGRARLWHPETNKTTPSEASCATLLLSGRWHKVTESPGFDPNSVQVKLFGSDTLTRTGVKELKLYDLPWRIKHEDGSASDFYLFNKNKVLLKKNHSFDDLERYDGTGQILVIPVNNQSVLIYVSSELMLGFSGELPRKAVDFGQVVYVPADITGIKDADGPTRRDEKMTKAIRAAVKAKLVKINSR